jgi:hypothetical protein
VSLPQVLTPPPAGSEEPGEAGFEPVCPEGGACIPVEDLPEGDPLRGEALFTGAEVAPDGTQLGCQACHSLSADTIVGPGMEGLSARIPEGYASAEHYIHESILAPDTYKRPGFEALVMPPTFGQRLDAQSLADLIAFLSGL